MGIAETSWNDLYINSFKSKQDVKFILNLSHIAHLSKHHNNIN